MTTDVRVSLDVFPARVAYPHGSTTEPVRAWIVEGRLKVYVDAAGGPRPTFDSEVISVQGAWPSGYSVLTPDGQVLLTKSGKCGCGSKLKRWVPWGDVRSVRVPL